MTKQTPYQKHMDDLARRVGNVLDGENYHNILSVCGAIIAFTLSEIPDQTLRQQCVDKVIGLIKTFSKHNYPGQHPHG